VTFDVNGFFGSQYGRLPVIDGDVSDVRPYDTKYGRCIVGLRWKDPRGKKAEGDAATEGGTKAAQMLKLALDRAFVLPVQLHDGVLVAGVSARQESIIDADDEEEE
jgi:hypothetical protein